MDSRVEPRMTDWRGRGQRCVATYLAIATAVHVSGSLEDYLSTVHDTGTAVGAEFMEMEGISLGL